MVFQVAKLMHDYILDAMDGAFTRFKFSVIRPLGLQLPQRLRMERISSTGSGTQWREAVA